MTVPDVRPAAPCRPSKCPVVAQVLLEQELAQLSAELDKDLRAIETGLPSPKTHVSGPPPAGLSREPPRGSTRVPAAPASVAPASAPFSRAGAARTPRPRSGPANNFPEAAPPDRARLRLRLAAERAGAATPRRDPGAPGTPGASRAPGAPALGPVSEGPAGLHRDPTPPHTPRTPDRAGRPGKWRGGAGKETGWVGSPGGPEARAERLPPCPRQSDFSLELQHPECTLPGPLPVSEPPQNGGRWEPLPGPEGLRLPVLCPR